MWPKKFIMESLTQLNRYFSIAQTKFKFIFYEEKKYNFSEINSY